MDWLYRPWPWYVAGPLLGLFPALLLIVGNKQFGVSSNLRHMCAVVAPSRLSYFGYDWRREGSWNLLFALGILGGGVIAGTLFANPDPVAISDATRTTLQGFGIDDFRDTSTNKLSGGQRRRVCLLRALQGDARLTAQEVGQDAALSGLADRRVPRLLER